MSLRIAYHDSCQTLRQLGLKSEPRRLLDLAGYEVTDIPDIANCCGFGGTFSLEWPRVGRPARRVEARRHRQDGLHRRRPPTTLAASRTSQPQREGEA